jgi:hypothetical protein
MRIVPGVAHEGTRLYASVKAFFAQRLETMHAGPI